MIIRSLIATLMVCCLAHPACAQTPPAQTPQIPAVKSPAKKPAAKAGRQTRAPAADSGPCKVGIITAAEDIFTVQKIGLTVFNNAYAEVPVTWGFDDLIFARARAAAGGISLRRLPYQKGAFDSYYHPKPSLFGHAREELTSLVRQIAGNAGCESYMLITRATAQLEGTNQRLTGFGVLSQGFFQTYLFVYFDVLVFDGQTFEIRRDPTANLKGALAHMAANLTTNEHFHDVDKTAYPASAPDAANSLTLRDGIRAFLTERLDKILPAYFRPDEQ